MAENEGKNCDERRPSRKNRYKREGRPKISEASNHVDFPAAAQEELEFVVRVVINGQAIEADRAFRMGPKLPWLPDKRRDHTEQHDAEHQPAQPFHDRIICELDHPLICQTAMTRRKLPWPIPTVFVEVFVEVRGSVNRQHSQVVERIGCGGWI